MPKRKLDAAFCQSAACEPGKKKTEYWDTTVSGFTLEVRSSGGKTYYLRYFDDRGKQRQVKLGRADLISFSQAKAKARKLRSEVELNGDPAKDKERRKAIPTYAELAKQHVDHAKTYQKRPENTESVINTHLLPRWGKLRLDEIKQQDIAKWLAEKRKDLAPATAEKLRILLGRSYELARQWQIPGAEINPVRGIPRFKFSNARERFLSPKEAQRLLHYADRSKCRQLGAIVRLLLLTGARKSELLKAEWRHVDLERKAWFIPDSKTGKSRHVPLSGEAIKVLQGLPRFKGCPYVVPQPRSRKPYTGLKQPWDTVRTKAGLGDLRIHDLRHSAASFMINAGVDLFAVGKVLGHSDTKSTSRYSHLADRTLLAAVEAGAAGIAMGGADGL